MRTEELVLSPNINREKNLRSKRGIDIKISTSNACEMDGKNQYQSEDITKGMTVQEHERFIGALEKHGCISTGEEFKLMAQELGSGWTPRRVQEYAFWYLNMIDNFNRKEGQDVASKNKDILNENELQQAKEKNEGEQLWNHQECILYDSLLAYTHPGGEASKISLEESDKIGRWEKIAAMIPNKTAGQCRDRYLAFHQGGGFKL